MKFKIFGVPQAAGWLCILLASCQQDDLTTPQGPYTSRSHDCETTCIDADDPVYQEHTDFVMETAGPNYRKFNYTVYNTLTGFELVWTYAASTPTPRRLTFIVSGGGFSAPVTYTTVCGAPPQSGSHTYVFDDDWAACDVVSFTARLEDCAGLLKVSKAGTYDLIGECEACDENADFSYVTSDNLNILFSYHTGAETGALTNAVVAFTFPQIIDLPLNDDGFYEAPDGKLYAVNNPTNQTVFTWTGDIGCSADEATTFAFSFEPDCAAEPARDGKANIWTDTKVNGESVKGTNANIVYTGCE